MIKEDFNKIKESEKFKAIISRARLVSCFLNDDQIKKLWEFNFFSEETKSTYTFFVDNNDVVLKDTNILISRNQNPEEVMLGNLKLEEKEVISIANFVLVKKYQEENFSKMILSIESQNRRILWNVTVVLKNLNVANIKINDRTSEVVEDKLFSPFTKQ